MLNPQRIVVMTKLALYEKHEGAADRNANDYFRHDYIYKKNMGTRIAVGIAGLIILAVYWVRLIFLEGVDVFELNIQRNLIDSILFIVVLMALYSLIGTIQGTREYYLMQKRLAKAEALLNYLERPEGAPLPQRGAKQNTTKRPRTEDKTGKKPVIPLPPPPTPQLRIRPSEGRSRYTKSAINNDNRSE
jgi:hypothetical protein